MSPRFPEVWCSQCGEGFGPGDHGYSHCEDHHKLIPSMCELPDEQRRRHFERMRNIYREVAAMEMALAAGDELIANMKPGNVVGDHPGVEINNKRNPWGWQ